MPEIKPKTKTSGRGVVIVTVGVLVVFTVLFAAAFLLESKPIATTEQEATLSADTYSAEVSALLANADAKRGETTISTLECASCHVQGAGTIAPPFTGLAERAATRRPPLSAADYIYESIINPGAFLAPNEKRGGTYPNAMLANYKQRLTNQQLGDIIAYLLTL